MLIAEHSQKLPWPLLRKILFRFFFIYLMFYISPWLWLSHIPGVDFVLNYYYQLFDWAVIKANANFFRVFGIKNVQPVFNGSGDTSYNWAMICLFISLSFIGTIIWTIAEWRKKSYRQLNYLLCLLTRYYLVTTAIGYGFLKMLGMQMLVPLNSQLATPLGDFLPMRLSWMFLGYSTPYQLFSGVMEVLVGVLLLYRRTVTMGVLVATAVFINVLMLNLAYDIPVKIHSMNLVLMCFYLVANEYERIACFFILHKPAPSCVIYQYPLTKKWMRVARIILKLAFVFILFKDCYGSWTRYLDYKKQTYKQPFTGGVYDVTKYVINTDTIPPLINDTVRWQNVIIDLNGTGSIQTSDTAFRRRYGRAYFGYTADTIAYSINFKKFPDDSTSILSMKYQLPDSNTIILKGKKQNDSLFVELKKINRHFQLAENQFHWLSEANR